METRLGLVEPRQGRTLRRVPSIQKAGRDGFHGADEDRAGDWRYIFRRSGEDGIEVLRVRNRREAYR